MSGSKVRSRIVAALALTPVGYRPRLLFHLPLRQAEGLLTSLFVLMGIQRSAPDHTTLSRRGPHLNLTLRQVPTGEGVHLIVDSTGLSVVGEREWAAATHGGHGKRGWKKLHLVVDAAGVILVHTLTEATVDDATTGVDLMEAVHSDLTSVTADAAYDTVAFYEAASARGAVDVVPPTKTAKLSRRRPRSPARDRTITNVETLGRRQWQKASGYHRRARVENAVFRYTCIIGVSHSCTNATTRWCGVRRSWTADS